MKTKMQHVTGTCSLPDGHSIEVVEVAGYLGNPFRKSYIGTAEQREAGVMMAIFDSVQTATAAGCESGYALAYCPHPDCGDKFSVPFTNGNQGIRDTRQSDVHSCLRDQDDE